MSEKKKRSVVKRTIHYSWKCDWCGSSGSCESAADMGAYEGGQLMLTLHRSVSPDCQGGADSIRVVFGDKIR